MDVLSLEKETATAVAKAEALQAAVDGSEQSSCKLQRKTAPFDPIERTRQFVAEQAKASEMHLLSQD